MDIFYIPAQHVYTKEKARESVAESVVYALRDVAYKDYDVSQIMAVTVTATDYVEVITANPEDFVTERELQNKTLHIDLPIEMCELHLDVNVYLGNGTVNNSTIPLRIDLRNLELEDLYDYYGGQFINKKYVQHAESIGKLFQDVLHEGLPVVFSLQTARSTTDTTKAFICVGKQKADQVAGMFNKDTLQPWVSANQVIAAQLDRIKGSKAFTDRALKLHARFSHAVGANNATLYQYCFTDRRYNHKGSLVYMPVFAGIADSKSGLLFVYSTMFGFAVDKQGHVQFFYNLMDESIVDAMTRAQQNSSRHGWRTGWQNTINVLRCVNLNIKNPLITQLEKGNR